MALYFDLCMVLVNPTTPHQVIDGILRKSFPMTMRRLADPVLNDLLLMVQGRRISTLSPQAVTRYQQHLDRLDGELATARLSSGVPAVSVTDEIVPISRTVLACLKGDVARMKGEVEAALAQLAAQMVAGPGIDVLADVLLTEFHDHLMGLEGSAVDVATVLLRRFKPSAAPPPESVTGKKARLRAEALAKQTSAHTWAETDGGAE